jgi:hypothetical protein
MELIGPFIAALLTLMVFSYILGDNILFKLATHIFVGVAVGYALIVIWRQVFIPALITNGIGQALVIIVLCIFLFLKSRPQQNRLTSALGSIGLAFVLGVGVALAISGGLLGTLLPQAGSMLNISLNPGDYPDTDTEVGLVQWLNSIIMLLGTLGTLFYFTFTVRPRWVLGGVQEGVVRFFAGMGRLMIIFTMGVLFANTVSSRVALLISRLQFLAGLFNGGG